VYPWMLSRALWFAAPLALRRRAVENRAIRRQRAVDFARLQLQFRRRLINEALDSVDAALNELEAASKDRSNRPDASQGALLRKWQSRRQAWWRNFINELAAEFGTANPKRPVSAWPQSARGVPTQTIIADQDQI